MQWNLLERYQKRLAGSVSYVGAIRPPAGEMPGGRSALRRLMLCRNPTQS